MGQIKLEMPNPYGVYIHGTAALILRGEERTNTVELLLATGASKTLKLSAPVPIHVVYMTA